MPVAVLRPLEAMAHVSSSPVVTPSRNAGERWPSLLYPEVATVRAFREGELNALLPLAALFTQPEVCSYEALGEQVSNPPASPPLRPNRAVPYVPGQALTEAVMLSSASAEGEAQPPPSYQARIEAAPAAVLGSSQAPQRAAMRPAGTDWQGLVYPEAVTLSSTFLDVDQGPAALLPFLQQRGAHCRPGTLPTSFVDAAPPSGGPPPCGRALQALADTLSQDPASVRVPLAPGGPQQPASEACVPAPRCLAQPLSLAAAIQGGRSEAVSPPSKDWAQGEDLAVAPPGRLGGVAKASGAGSFASAELEAESDCSTADTEESRHSKDRSRRSCSPGPSSCGAALVIRLEHALGPAEPEACVASACTGAVPSLGSRLHHLGICRPCAFVHQDGCKAGLECRFCHLCDAGVRKQQKKEKRQLIRAARQRRKQVSLGSGIGS